MFSVVVSKGSIRRPYGVTATTHSRSCSRFLNSISLRAYRLDGPPSCSIQSLPASHSTDCKSSKSPPGPNQPVPMRVCRCRLWCLGCQPYIGLSVVPGGESGNSAECPEGSLLPRQGGGADCGENAAGQRLPCRVGRYSCIGRALGSTTTGRWRWDRAGWNATTPY